MPPADPAGPGWPPPRAAPSRVHCRQEGRAPARMPPADRARPRAETFSGTTHRRAFPPGAISPTRAQRRSHLRSFPWRLPRSRHRAACQRECRASTPVPQRNPCAPIPRTRARAPQSCPSARSGWQSLSDIRTRHPSPDTLLLRTGTRARPARLPSRVQTWPRPSDQTRPSARRDAARTLGAIPAAAASRDRARPRFRPRRFARSPRKARGRAVQVRAAASRRPARKARGPFVLRALRRRFRGMSRVHFHSACDAMPWRNSNPANPCAHEAGQP